MNKEREEFISGRHDTLGKSWVNELWVRVIQKAIDDLALFKRMHEDGEYISEENIFHADTAYNFLFNPEHVISIGITLEELLNIWGFENITQWREAVAIKIENLIEEKRQAKEQKRRIKCMKMKKQQKIE